MSLRGARLPGCFLGTECILICKECLAEMISGDGIHPDLIEMSCRDELDIFPGLHHRSSDLKNLKNRESTGSTVMK